MSISAIKSIPLEQGLRQNEENNFASISSPIKSIPLEQGLRRRCFRLPPYRSEIKSIPLEQGLRHMIYISFRALRFPRD